MSDEGRERGEAAWLKGDVGLLIFFFFFKNLFTSQMGCPCILCFFAWERRLNRFTGKESLGRLQWMKKIGIA